LRWYSRTCSRRGLSHFPSLPPPLSTKRLPVSEGLNPLFPGGVRQPTPGGRVSPLVSLFLYFLERERRSCSRFLFHGLLMTGSFTKQFPHAFSFKAENSKGSYYFLKVSTLFLSLTQRFSFWSSFFRSRSLVHRRSLFEMSRRGTPLTLFSLSSLPRGNDQISRRPASAPRAPLPSPSRDLPFLLQSRPWTGIFFFTPLQNAGFISHLRRVQPFFPLFPPDDGTISPPPGVERPEPPPWRMECNPPFPSPPPIKAPAPKPSGFPP